jgi:hypothetical protein
VVKTIVMSRFSKTLLIITVFFLAVNVAIADRGTGKKSRTKLALNISTPTSLRNSISFNLKSGLTYKGSLLTSDQAMSNKSIMTSSIVTYQKGNTIYIIPYKHTIVMPDLHQGYAGVKFVLQPK